MKPKNDTLKNDEQPRSFIQRNWLFLLTLFITTGIGVFAWISPPYWLPFLPTLDALVWWRHINNAFIAPAMLLPVFLVIYNIVRFLQTRRRPYARFRGIFTGILVIAAFCFALASNPLSNSYHFLPDVEMSEGHKYTVVTWTSFFEKGYVVYAHTPDANSVNVIARGGLRQYRRPFPYIGSAIGLDVEVRKDSGDLEIYREDKLITSISLADGE